MEAIVAGSQSKQKATYWRKIVRNLKESNLSISEFTKKHQISPSKLSYWKLRLSRDNDKKSDFIEVKEASPSWTDDSIFLTIGDVVTINFSSPPSPQWISELIGSIKEVA